MKNILIFIFISLSFFVIIGCDTVEPDKEITFSVSGRNITIYNLFKDGSSWTVTVEYDVYQFIEKVTSQGENHTLEFSKIQWNYYNPDPPKIISFNVIIDGKVYNYKSLYIGILDQGKYINPFSSVSVVTGSQYKFYAMDAQGKVNWSISKNTSGGSINDEGLYTSGQPTISSEYDEITAIDSKNNSDVIKVRVILKSEIVDSTLNYSVTYPYYIVLTNDNLFVCSYKKPLESDLIVYKLKNNGMIEDSIKTPFNSIDGITWDGKYLWIHGGMYQEPASISLSYYFYTYDSVGKLIYSHPTSSGFIGLAFANNSLWTIMGTYLIKMELVEDKLTTNYETYELKNYETILQCFGLDFHNNYLWARMGSKRIQKIDLEGNLLTYAEIVDQTYGLTWDNDDYIWVSCLYKNLFYKIKLVDK